MHLLLTFSTYGAWLHGDARGSHHADGRVEGSNSALRQFEASIMVDEPFSLDARARDVVIATLRQVCSHKRWGLRSAHARTEHVHTVIDSDADGGRTASQLKAWCSRRLVEANAVPAGRRIWSRGYNVAVLRGERAVAEACGYVLFRQGERMSCWSGE